ncbi:MAG: NAD(P)H-binding protein [Planctomycetaceae bacterium]
MEPILQSGGSALVAGCGYLGRRVADRLLARGITVYTLTRSTEKADQFRQAGLQPIVGHLEKRHGLPVLPPVDAVLWAVGFDRQAGNSRESVWLDGLRQLVQSLSRNPPPRRFVYVSSTGVYGDAGGSAVDESTAAIPTTESGQVCLKGEQLLSTTLSHHLPQTLGVILRMAGIFGPGRLLRRVQDLREGTPIAAAPDDWLNLIHVDDATSAVEYFLTQPVAVNDLLCQPSEISSAATANTHDLPTINIANQPTLTRRQYYSTLARACDAPAPVFASAKADQSREGETLQQERHRPSSGNKQITSIFRSRLKGLEFQYDDIQKGIRASV